MTSIFKNRVKSQKSYKARIWYHIDDIMNELPQTVLRTAFRKPEIGEKIPGGLSYNYQDACDTSDFEMCIISFRIKIIVDYNEPITAPGTDTGE